MMRPQVQRGISLEQNIIMMMKSIVKEAVVNNLYSKKNI